jgi:hypothetical protein
MTTDNSATPVVSFEYGTVKTLSEVVIGIPTENPVGAPNAGSNFNSDGTITIFIDKSKVGNPQPGDLLGAVNGRTFSTGDTPPETLERSNQLVDHTFVKGNTDNSYPPATYTLVGNTLCSVSNVAPVSAVSRKTHGSAGDFDVDLPITGAPGIEDRSGGSSGDHKIIITFAAPVTLGSATVTPGAGGTASISGTPTVSNTQITVNLTNVSDAQTLAINLLGVHQGSNVGNVTLLMGVLLADTDASRRVDSNDVTSVRQNTLQTVTASNFRDDVDVSGRIDSNDVTITRQGAQGLKSLP